MIDIGVSAEQLVHLVDTGDERSAITLLGQLTPSEREELESFFHAKAAHLAEQEAFCAEQALLAQCVAETLEETGARNLNEILDNPQKYGNAIMALDQRVRKLGLVPVFAPEPAM
jgi:hypothetical protein